MKRFEYMEDYDINNKFEKSGISNFTQFLNQLGNDGWDISVRTTARSGGCAPAYFAKREIIDEPSQQRTVRREMEFSRA